MKIGDKYAGIKRSLINDIFPLCFDVQCEVKRVGYIIFRENFKDFVVKTINDSTAKVSYRIVDWSGKYKRLYIYKEHKYLDLLLELGNEESQANYILYNMLLGKSMEYAIDSMIDDYALFANRMMMKGRY